MPAGTHHHRGLERRHQARVKTDEAELLDSRGLHAGAHALVQLGEREGVVVIGLIRAEAADTAAVVPEQKGIAIRRVLLHAPGDEVGQDLWIAQVLFAQVIDFLQRALLDQQALGGRPVLDATHAVAGQARAAIAQHDDVHGIIGSRLHHLLEVFQRGRLEVVVREHVHEHGPAGATADVTRLGTGVRAGAAFGIGGRAASVAGQGLARAQEAGAQCGQGEEAEEHAVTCAWDAESSEP
jgi:hypothetical protein